MNKNTLKIIYLALLAFLIFVVLPALLVYGDYAVAALSSIAFGIGLCFTLLMTVNGKQRLGRLFKYSLIPLLAAVLSCMIIAGEGFICFLVVGLLFLIPYYLGFWAGYAIQNWVWIKHTLMLITLAFFAAASTQKVT